MSDWRTALKADVPIRGSLRAGMGAGSVGNLRRAAVPAQEQGYVLLFAIFLIALLTIALAVAAPKMARSIQRDRDLETFHRGMQYRRAIQLYYRKFHAYPPNVDALVNTNDIRFLRKKYLDPSTGQDDWKPIAFGQNKTPTAMGFFGQPLAGNPSTVAGIGPGGLGGLPGGAGGLAGTAGGGFSLNTPDTSGDQSAAGGATSGAGGTADNSGGGGATSSTGSTIGGTPAAGSSAGSGGPTFGGAGVIGVEPASPKQAILVYKKKNHYNEWEFTYDPLSDMQTVGGGNAGLIGQPAGSNPASTTPASPNFGPGPSPAPNMPPETTPQ